MEYKNIKPIGPNPIRPKRRSIRFSMASLLLVALLIPFLNIGKILAVTLTWDGGGADNNWSTCANWTTDTCPVAGDSVVFNATSTKNSIVDGSFGGSITALTISSGYTGTITMARSLTLSGAFNQADGTFTADGQTLDMNSSFTLSGGSFTASSTTTTLAGAMTISGSPTFAHNSGTWTFDGGTAATLSCNNVTFSSVTFAHTGSVAKTVNSNCSLPLGNNPTAGGDLNADIVLNGTLSGTGTLTIGTAGGGNTLTLNSGSSLSGFAGLIGGDLTASSATYDLGSYTTFTLNDLYSQTGGDVTVPDGADFNHLTLNSPAPSKIKVPLL